MERVDVCVVGAGQSGLAVGYHLHRANRDRRPQGRPEVSFALLDAHDRPGGAWPDAWSSLELFSPASYSSLPGRLMPAHEGSGNPPARHVAAYLADYERRYALPVRRPVTVTDVRDDPDGAGDEDRLRVTTSDGELSTRHLVNATGTWDRPFWPRLPGMAGPDGFRGTQVHTHDYRGPTPYAGKRVLVVGGGNSGAQIAADLLPVADTLRWVALRPPRYLPDDVDGRVLFETATQAVRDRAAGRPVRGVASLGDVVAVPSVRAARDEHGLRAEPMVRRLTPYGAAWPDGHEAPFDAVVWATGFRPALRHLHHLGLATTGGRPDTSVPPAPTGPTGPAVPVHAVRSTSHEHVWFVGYGDWCGAASATLIGVGRPARDVVASLLTSDLADPTSPSR